MVGRGHTETITPYQILGVRPNASYNEILKAYRTLAMIYHPDRGGNEFEFHQIKDAYDQLKLTFTKNEDIRVSITVDIEQIAAGKDIDILVNYNEQKKIVKCKLPIWTTNGDTIKIDGCGNHTYSHVKAGDLYVDVTVTDTARFSRIGDTCIHKYPLNIKHAMTGTTITVTDIYGTNHKITIPAGTQSYDIFSIPHCGFFNKRSCKNGNFDVYCIVHIPKIHNPNTRIYDLP